MNNSLAEVRPELVPEWSEKNLPLKPDEITFGSNKKVWWRGACGHEWQTSVKARSNGEKCPICSGARVIAGINDLATLEPLLVKQWSKKNKIKPTEVSIGSHKKVIWRCEKGDWAKYIQPITNKLCQEYGLSIIDVEDGSKEKQHENYKDWSEYREGSFVWADMIKRDLDACILQANDFSGFLELLSEKGYEVKQGKYLAVRPQGMTRFRRCKTLGENYSQEAIVERIAKEDLSFYQSQNEEKQAAIVKCYVKRYRRAKMSGLQKRYYAKLYRIRKLKKKPYSQVWKYKDDIRKMHKLQEQYLFLVRHKIESAEELVSVLDNLTDKKKEASKEKSKTYKSI